MKKNRILSSLLCLSLAAGLLIPGLPAYAEGEGESGSSSSGMELSKTAVANGDDTYTITLESTKNGTVTVAPKTASKGTTVTLTVEPDKGYTLETLTVTDKNGNEIELTNKGDGKYTFKMPAGKVYVEATFMEDNSILYVGRVY